MRNVQSRSREGPNRRFTSRSWPFDPNFDALHPVLITRHAGGGHGGLLRGIGSALTGAFETDRTRGRPTDGAPVRGRDGHNGVIKRGLDTSQAMRHDPALTFLFELLLALRRFPRCRSCCSLLWFLGHCFLLIETRLLASHDFLLSGHGALARTLTRAGIRMRALA